jgi:hypothetical protein
MGRKGKEDGGLAGVSGVHLIEGNIRRKDRRDVCKDPCDCLTYKGRERRMGGWWVYPVCTS